MALKLGSADITKVYTGSTQAQKVYLGSNQIYTAEPPQLTLTQRNAIDAIVAASISGSSTPGAIVDITGPQGSYTKAYGNTLAAIGQTARPVTTADKFRMGSVTKTFTALAFWQAVDRGQISLTNTLNTYITGIPSGSSITMAHLLSMRSGVYDFTYDPLVLIKILTNPAGPYSAAEAIALAKANPSQFTPGSQSKYVNTNAVLIGAILEQVTGRRLRDIFQEDIFTPLGLADTKWPTDVNAPVPGMDTSTINPELFNAAGCLVTTVQDLTKWLFAMRDGLLISSSSQTLRTTTFPSTDPNPGAAKPPNNTSYGYFMMRFGSWIGHEGTVANAGTACVYDTVSGATIVVAQNNPGWLTGGTEYYVTMRNIAAYLYPDSVLDPA